MATSDTIQKGIRFSVDGGDIVIREFRQIGDTAERELGRLGPAAQRAAVGMQAVDRQARATEVAISQAAQRTARQSGAAYQNVAFQLQDIIVSLEAGQNPLRVIIQQGTQIAGAFGPVAAIFGAVGAAVLIAGSAFLGLSGDASTATAAVDAFNDANDQTIKTLGSAATSIEELAASYRLLGAEAKTAEEQALRANIRTAEAAQKAARAALQAQVEAVLPSATSLELERINERTQGQAPERFPGERASRDLARQLRAEAEFSERSIAGLANRMNELIDATPEAAAEFRALQPELARVAKAALDAEENLRKDQARLAALGGDTKSPEVLAAFGTGAGASGGMKAIADLRAEAQRELDQTATETADKVRVVQRELAAKLGEIGQQRATLNAQLAGTGEADTSRRDALQQDLDTLRQVEQQYRQAADRRVQLINETAAKQAEAERKRREAEARRLAAPELRLERADDRLLADMRSALGKPQDPREAAIFEAQRRLSATATEAERTQVEQLAGALYDEALAAKEAAKAKQEGIALSDRYRTASEALADQERELADLLRQGAIDQVTYDRAIAAERKKAADATKAAMREQLEATRTWQAGFKIAFGDYADAATNANRAAQEAADLGFRGIESGLAGAIGMLARGETAFEDWQEAGSEAIATIAEDLARLAIRYQITGPLAAALFGGVSGGVSGGAGQADLGGGGVGGDLLLNAKGNAFDRGQLMFFAKGGVVDRPVVFPMARGAGLMGEAGPEAVMPLRRTPDGRLGVAASGGGGVNVKFEVINQSAGAQVTQERRTGPDGQMTLTAIVRDVIASGGADKAMSTRYGVSPTRSGARR